MLLHAFIFIFHLSTAHAYDGKPGSPVYSASPWDLSGNKSAAGHPAQSSGILTATPSPTQRQPGSPASAQLVCADCKGEMTEDEK